MDIREQCAEAYGRWKNLKLVGQELNVPWQTVYVYLRQLGVAVTGDKSRYGSATDRLAVKGERLFANFVPGAVDNNESQFQAKIDFSAYGHGVDVKTATLKSGGHKCKKRRWAFCLKKQEMIADFVVLFALGDMMELKHCFLLPGEIIRHYQTISISETLASKWKEYLVDAYSLDEFFRDLPAREG